MKYFIPIVFIYFIKIASISFAQEGEEGLCSEQYKKDLPAWLSRWKSSDYGLEFTNSPNTDDNIPSGEKLKEVTYNAGGPAFIREMIIDHLEKVKQNESQFDIERLDPIEYEDSSNTKMWLILKNISFFNLDTYDPDTITYHRKGTREYGPYTLTQDTYESLKNIKKPSRKIRHFLNKIEENNRIFDRTDIIWNIAVSAKFKPEISNKEKDSPKNNTPQTEDPESSMKPENKPIVKPIIVKAEFKIQPQKNENESSSSTSKSPEPLRARGVLTLHVHDFGFELTIIERHIDQLLREILPENKRCKNRVPDLDVQYRMKQLDIEEIKLTKYDKDDEWQIEPENNLDDVNDKEINTIDETDSEPASERSENHYNLMDEDKNKVKEVMEHLDILRAKIQDISGGEIRKRLCINIMPKMAWKTMQMKSKRQLPGLIRQIVQYNRNFKRKSNPPEASSIGVMSMTKTAFSFGKSFAKSTLGI